MQIQVVDNRTIRTEENQKGLEDLVKLANAYNRAAGINSEAFIGTPAKQPRPVDTRTAKQRSKAPVQAASTRHIGKDVKMASAAQPTSGDLPHVTLYWLEQSRSQRILWLLEECKNVTYDVVVFKRGKDKLAPAELKKIHPLGKSPVISVKASPTAEAITIAESGFMTEYLSQYFAPHLVPKRYKEGQEGKVAGETEAWLRHSQLLHYAEGSLMSILVGGLLIDGIRNAPVPFFVKPITSRVAQGVDDAFLLRNYDNQFTYLNSLLETSGGNYLCGKDLTAADILCSFPIIAASSRHGYDKYPALKAYAKRLQEEPGFKSAIAVIEKKTGEKYQHNF